MLPAAVTSIAKRRFAFDSVERIDQIYRLRAR